MNKKELSRYFWLRHEIRRQEKRVERMERTLQACKEQGTVGDTVNDYRSGKGIPVRIEGLRKEEFSMPAMIGLLKEEIEKNIEESEQRAVDIEKFIQGVEDPQLRELLRCRFIECMKWEEIGKENFIDPSHARKLIRNFLKET